MNKKLLTLALAVTAGLAACGGGSDDVAAPANQVPDSAMRSPGAYSRFAASLPNSETAAPLETNPAEPPVSDSAEPISVS